MQERALAQSGATGQWTQKKPKLPIASIALKKEEQRLRAKQAALGTPAEFPPAIPPPPETLSLEELLSFFEELVAAGRTPGQASRPAPRACPGARRSPRPPRRTQRLQRHMSRCPCHPPSCHPPAALLVFWHGVRAVAICNHAQARFKLAINASVWMMHPTGV